MITTAQNVNQASDTRKQVRLDPEDHRRLSELADKDRRDMGDEIGWLVDEELKRREAATAPADTDAKGASNG